MIFENFYKYIYKYCSNFCIVCNSICYNVVMIKFFYEVYFVKSLKFNNLLSELKVYVGDIEKNNEIDLNKCKWLIIILRYECK